MGYSQITTTPGGANSCSCSGSVTFTAPVASPATFQVFDYAGNLMGSGSSPTGQYFLDNLCGEAYSLVMVQGGATTTYVFNIMAGNTNPGNSTMLDVCSTGGNINLNSQLTGFAAGGTWQNPSGAPIGNMLAASSAVSGWYTYHYNGGGCPIVTGILVNFVQNANPGLSTTYLICEDYDPFELIEPMEGNPDGGGQWYYTSNNQPMNGWFYPATMNSQQFYYTINNVPGCGPVTSFLTVTENQNPSSGTSQSIEVCQGASPINMTNYLGGTPQTGGSWYSPSSAPVSNMFNPATQPAGAYLYHVNGLTPCASQESYLTISFVPNNPSGANASTTLCASGAPLNMFNTLNGNPLSGGTWTNSANQSVDGIFNPANETPGNYTYRYPAIGCTIPQAILSVGVEQLVNAGNDGGTNLCESVTTFNLNSLLSSGVPTNGVWTNENGTVVPANTTIDASDLNQEFTYTITPTVCPPDAATFDIEIANVQPPLINQSIDFCATDAAVDLGDYYPGHPMIVFTSLGGTPVSAVFNPSAQSSVTYTAINPDMGACVGSQASLAINVEQPAFQSGIATVDVCQSAQVYDLNTSNNAIDFTNGHWEDENGVPVSNNVTLNFTGARVYEFVSDAQLLCAASTYTVTVNSFEQYTAGEDNTVTLCNSDAVQSLTSMSGSLGSGNGAWYFNTNPVTDIMFDPATDAEGTYSYVIPANGACPEVSSDLVIDVEYGINYSAGNDVTQCFGSSPVQLGQQGQLGTSYQWSPATNLSSTISASPQVNFYSANAAPVTITYTVIVNDGICTAQDQVVVTTLPRPVSNFANEYQICRGEAVNLSVIGNNVSCEWMPAALFNNGTGQFQLVEPEATTNVEVMITNEWNCVEYDSTTITVHQLPIISFMAEATPGCPPLDVHYEYSPVSGESIHWSIPAVGTFHGNELNTVLNNTGTYNLTLTAVSVFGCERTVQYSQLIEVYPEPLADFDMSPVEITTVDPVAQFVNTSLGAESYEWDFDSIGTSTEVHPTYEFPNADPKTFIVCLHAENEFGCLDTSCQFLPLDNIYIFYAPTAITPDDDGINDGFKPVLLGFEEGTYSFRVYNRWGEKIFETHDIDEPWMANSQRGDYYVPEGVYTWRVEVKEKIIANFEVFEGHVLVIR